jgi:hypothetical protein
MSVNGSAVQVATDRSTINLSLVSHTNVGKTTLARTLLRRDIGEVRDRAHVTETAEAHVLIETARGDVLRLWDTPGFGDSARLLKRLRLSENAIGWLLTQVWDRLTDRPFYSSQQALRNAREESDVILYLVNAAEDPASAGRRGRDADPELDRQAGAAAAESDGRAARRGRRGRGGGMAPASRGLSWVRGALGLDAFARCWVQEDALLGAVGGLLPATRHEAFTRLRTAWRVRNAQVFEESMTVLARQLAAVATDRATVAARGLKDAAGRWLSSLLAAGDKGDPEGERAMTELAGRLDAAVRDATDRLIALHGLSGRAAAQILARVAGQFDVSRPADVGKSGVIGGLVSGALGGLAADVAAGGLTFGAGALIGGLLGALGAGGAAQAYNLMRGTSEGQIGWSADFLTQRVSAALLRYLAVAHFGRGRGDWVEGEYPPHWQALAEEVTAARRAQLDDIWRRAEAGATRGEVEALLQPLVGGAGRALLVRLYPEATEVFQR